MTLNPSRTYRERFTKKLITADKVDLILGPYRNRNSIRA